MIILGFFFLSPPPSPGEEIKMFLDQYGFIGKDNQWASMLNREIKLWKILKGT